MSFFDKDEEDEHEEEEEDQDELVGSQAGEGQEPASRRSAQISLLMNETFEEIEAYGDGCSEAGGGSSNQVEATALSFKPAD